ncbi:MAG: hypothetical protein FJW31_20790 [Acidobacteria bacterium]|nr:hypothetical protein [Acidobacteriota bacterium]
MTKRVLPVIAAGLALGVSAWSLASAEGRIDADERVSAILPPPTRPAVWEPSAGFQAFSFGGQAALGVAVFGLACARLRRRAR